MNYPIYIVSKGRWKNPITAKYFLANDIPFKIVVEPQEAEEYKKTIGENYVEVLPFSNLGKGSYPARNYCWEDAKRRGYKRHWVFDDNIYSIHKYYKGKRPKVKDPKIAISMIEDFTDRYTNIAISGFNYRYFVIDTHKPFFLNTHVYSAMLIKNDIPFKWRLIYNEDVDLCLQVLNSGYCTVLFNSVNINKVSTVAKMSGGNQEELYKNNDPYKKLIKSKSLKEVWRYYVNVIYRFGRPHHHVNWKKHFKQRLKRRKDLDWNKIKEKKYDL